MVSSIQENIPHPRWEVRQIMKIALFSVKALITLTCRNSLINPVTNKFYFGILIRVANETNCESLIDQWRKNLFGANFLDVGISQCLHGFSFGPLISYSCTCVEILVV